MRIVVLIFKIILTVLFLALAPGCKKEEGQVPILITSEINNITQTSALAGGQIISQGSSILLKIGICWSTEDNPAISDSIMINEAIADTFNCIIGSLRPGTKYFVRSFAENTSGTGYGEERSFETEPATVPVISTGDISSITQNSAVCGYIITSDGASDIVSRGVCWSTLENPSVNDHFSNDGSGIGTFSSVISGLTGNTTYYIRAYSTNSVGTSYGNQIIFKTCPVIPLVSTLSSSSISAISAVFGGKITSDGGDSVIFRGVCWSLSQNPSIIDHRTVDGIGIGTFYSKIDKLLPSNTYYVRAYATNVSGTAYGDQISFSTLDGIPKPSIAKTVAIASKCVTLSVNISTDGGAEIVKKGICISLNHNPTINDKYTVDGIGTGSYSSHLEGLYSNEVYYARPYVISELGTFYGAEISFETLGTILDIEGNVYQIASIGDQIWMAENLGTLKYNDGTKISQDFSTHSSTGWCWDNPSNIDFKRSYGVFYNIQTIASGKLCPVGWHIPKSSEWASLISQFGSNQYAGGKLKMKDGWLYPNTDATNESCFSAKAAGTYSLVDTLHQYEGIKGSWWVDLSQGVNGWAYGLYYNSPEVVGFSSFTEFTDWNIRLPDFSKRFARYFHRALSVRCIKDK